MSKNTVLCEAESFSDAFRKLYNAARQDNPRVSLALVCRRLGLKSRGHLSEVLSGKRRIGRERFEKIAAYFKLDDMESAFLKALRDLEYLPKGTAKSAVTERVDHLRKVLTVSYEVMPPQLSDLFFAFKVFAAFGLFGREATLKKLVGVFGADKKRDVEVALKKLVDLKVCVEQTSCFEIGNDVVLFSATNEGLSHIQFIKQSLMDAVLGADLWFAKPGESRFHSTILSVNREKYTKYIQELRARIIEDQTQLESSEADMLIHYNLQIYPVTAAGFGRHR